MFTRTGTKTGGHDHRAPAWRIVTIGAIVMGVLSVMGAAPSVAAAAVVIESNWVTHEDVARAQEVAREKNLPMILYLGSAPDIGVPHYRDKTFARFVGVWAPATHRPLILKNAMTQVGHRIGASHHYWVYLLAPDGTVIATMPKDASQADRAALAKFAHDVLQWRVKADEQLADARKLADDQRFAQALQLIDRVVETDGKYTELAHKTHRATEKADPPGTTSQTDVIRIGGPLPPRPDPKALAEEPDIELAPLNPSKYIHFASDVAKLRERIDTLADGVLGRARKQIEQDKLDDAKQSLATLARDGSDIEAVATARQWLELLERGDKPVFTDASKDTDKDAPAAPPTPAAEKPADAGQSKDAPAVAAGDADAKFVSSKNSKKVHRADCTWAKRIGEDNRVWYKAYRAAADAGLEPCKVCNPQKEAGAKEGQ